MDPNKFSSIGHEELLKAANSGPQNALSESQQTTQQQTSQLRRGDDDAAHFQRRSSRIHQERSLQSLGGEYAIDHDAQAGQLGALADGRCITVWCRLSI